MYHLSLVFNKIFVVISPCFIVALMFHVPHSASIEKSEKPKLVIVIDDIGHQRASAEAALALKSVEEYRTIYSALRSFHKQTQNEKSAATREKLRNYSLTT